MGARKAPDELNIGATISMQPAPGKHAKQTVRSLGIRNGMRGIHANRHEATKGAT